MLNDWISSNDVFALTTASTLELMKGKYTFNYLQYQGVWCVAMSCGGGNFSPDGAYDSALDSVMPMKENTPSIKSSTLEDVGCVLLAQWLVQLLRRNLRRQPQLFPVQVEGQGSQCRRCSSTGTVRGSMGRLFRAVYTGTRPGVSPAIRVGKGWRGRRELAPRRSATRISCMRWRISTETCVMHHVRTTTTTTTVRLRHGHARFAGIVQFALCCQVQDVRHFGRCAPEGQLCSEMLLASLFGSHVHRYSAGGLRYQGGGRVAQTPGTCLEVCGCPN